MWTPEYFVRFVELPACVDGVTIPNDDGTFDIYINSLLSEDRKQNRLQHEIKHIQKDHFYKEKSVALCEMEANGEKFVERIKAQESKLLPNVFRDHPPKTIPVFNSLEVFRDYMYAMRDQYKKEKSADEQRTRK